MVLLYIFSVKMNEKYFIYFSPLPHKMLKSKTAKTAQTRTYDYLFYLLFQLLFTLQKYYRNKWSQLFSHCRRVEFFLSVEYHININACLLHIYTFAVEINSTSLRNVLDRLDNATGGLV